MLKIPASFAFSVAVALLVGCSAEIDGPADDATDESLEGLTADDAEARAIKLLAEADAKHTNFENAENQTRASSEGGVSPADTPLGGPAIGLRTLSDDARAGLGQGTWGFRFVVVSPGGAGERKVLSEGNTATKLLGASSFKLFTGWTAFKTGSTKVNTLTLMLRASKNALANLAMCQNGEKLRGYDAPCVARTNPTTALRFKDAIPATLSYLREQGVAFSPLYAQKDGSGLNPNNTLTVDDLTAILDEVNADPRRSEFLRMLAQPGVASTLEARFPGLEGKLFAKTGTYYQDGGGVKVLAGFAELGPQSTLLFVVVGNGVGDPARALDRVETVVRLHIATANDG